MELERKNVCLCLSCGMPSGMFFFQLFLNGLYFCYFCSRRGVFLLAAALRQHVLPPRGSASLHDPADDERLFKSEGKHMQAQRSLLSHLVASSVSLFSTLADE